MILQVRRPDFTILQVPMSEDMYAGPAAMYLADILGYSATERPWRIGVGVIPGETPQGEKVACLPLDKTLKFLPDPPLIFLYGNEGEMFLCN